MIQFGKIDGKIRVKYLIEECERALNNNLHTEVYGVYYGDCKDVSFM